MSMFVLSVGASGFLWHQIRCITSILFHVGVGLESPQVPFRFYLNNIIIFIDSLAVVVSVLVVD